MENYKKSFHFYDTEWESDLGVSFGSFYFNSILNVCGSLLCNSGDILLDVVWLLYTSEVTNKYIITNI